MSPAERWYRRALRAYPRAVARPTATRSSRLRWRHVPGAAAWIRVSWGRWCAAACACTCAAWPAATAGTAMRGGLALLAFPLALLLLAVALAGSSVIAFPPGPWSVGVAERGVGVLGWWWPLLALGGLVALAGLAAGRRSPAVAGALVVVAVLAADAWQLHPRLAGSAPGTQAGSTSRSCGSMPPARSPPLPPPGLPSRRCFPAHCWRRRSSLGHCPRRCVAPWRWPPLRSCSRLCWCSCVRSTLCWVAGAAASGGPARDGGARAC